MKNHFVAKPCFVTFGWLSILTTLVNDCNLSRDTGCLPTISCAWSDYISRDRPDEKRKRGFKVVVQHPKRTVGETVKRIIIFLLICQDRKRVLLML